MKVFFKGEVNRKIKISIPILIFRIVSIIIILIAIYYLHNWKQENKNNSEIISTIKSEIVFLDPINNNNEEEISEKKDMLLDFSTFIEYNPDTVAWIEINNTNVDFPVVKSTDNQFYLKHNFYKKNNSAGWIFADYRNKFDSTDKNIIIYGHNRRDGSMFSSLNNMLEKSWYSNPDNHIITLYTPTETTYYQIFSIYKTLANRFQNTIFMNEDDEFKNYINNSLSQSIYNFNVDVSEKDNILTIYTCANNNQYRVIVDAKKLK